jgi:hypothetical protein
VVKVAQVLVAVAVAGVQDLVITHLMLLVAVMVAQVELLVVVVALEKAYQLIVVVVSIMVQVREAPLERVQLETLL